MLCFTNHTSWASSSSGVVYVYDDEGVGRQSLKQTLAMFAHSLPNHSVKTIGADKVIANDWSKDAVLFVMPAGADLPYVKKLNGTGNKNIRNFVEKGGAYLGICAGAYYGSAYVEFDKGGELEVLGDRELAFFPGKSIGPILAKYDYKSNKGARTADIGKTVVYYNGGGYFENADKFSNISILANYQNKLPAITLVKIGNGKAVLSGVHFEFDADLMDEQDLDLKKIIPTLKAHNSSRLTLISEILEKLGLKP